MTRVELPTIKGGWPCVLVDPPWRFQSNSEANPGRNAMRHYACMSPEKIADLPVWTILAADAWVFLWVTGPFLAIGGHLEIFGRWGLRPSSIGFVWEKGSFGPGFTTRQSCEFIVIGRRGKPPRKSASVRQFISEPKREHSRKPDEIYPRIEALCEGPRLELFARQSRPGWSTWGNEATKFDEMRPK